VKRQCTLKVASDLESESISLSTAKTKFVLFNFYNIYVDKNSFECSSESYVTSVAIAGFSFLVMTGLVLIALIIVLVCYCLHKRRYKGLTFKQQIGITQNDNLEINKNCNNKFNNENLHNFPNMDFNNPQPVQIINPRLSNPTDNDQGIIINESADNAAIMFNKNNCDVAERISLNVSRNNVNKNCSNANNINEENNFISNEIFRVKKEIDAISKEAKQEMSEENVELAKNNMQDAPLPPDFK